MTIDLLRCNVLAVTVLVTAPLHAQDSRPIVPDAAVVPDPAPRAPLLREGSALVDAAGNLHRGRQTGTWEFVVPGPTAAPAGALTLLPGAYLGELEQVVISTGMADDPAGPQFRLTGVVYEFDHENYLMLTHPGLLLTAQSAPRDTPPVGETGRDETDDDSADAIIRNLEQSVGPIAQRPEATRAPVARSELRLEGDKIVRRRGRVRRTASGAYLFVFDADSSGTADPPMTLLPCRLLERIDRHMRSQPQRRVPLLVTGHVYTYNGHNYLLPTVHQVPRERTKLSP